LYADEEGEVFLGRSMGKSKQMSDETASLIDNEIKSIIDRNYYRAKEMIEQNMDILHAMKEALMQYETIDSKQIEDLMARREVRQPEHWEPKDKKPGASDGGNAETPDPVIDDKPAESHGS
jgi:cell division protease FtsH